MLPERAHKALQRARALIQSGQAEAALAEIDKAQQKAPKAAEVWQLRGHALAELERWAEAEPCFRRVTEAVPKDANGWANLGISRSARGLYREAIGPYLKAMALGAGVDVLHNLGSCHLELGDHRKAVDVFEDLVVLQDHPDNWTLLGIAYQGLERHGDALAAYRRAQARGGASYTLELNLGACLSVLERPDEAARAAERALQVRPDDPVALRNLGAAELAAGQVEAAIAAYARCTLPEAGPARLLALNYLDPADPARLRREHEALGAELAAAAADAPPLVAGRFERAAGEPLRVGFVSPDLREHPVAFFFEGLLAALSRERLALHLYSDVARGDALTQRLRAACEARGDRWRDTAALGGAAFAAAVAEDRVHVLIDLAGPTGASRFATFARRLAPVQASYLGYGATSGLPTMDAVLTDEVLAPLPAAQAQYTETLVPLGPVFATYTPPSVALPPAPGGTADRGPTFASFAQLRKITPSTLAFWAEALRAVPAARLLVMSKGLGSEPLRDALLARLAASGVARERVELRPAADLAAYLAAHDEVDVLLDTTPWSGHTTTLHGAWMGVPTLTLAGTTTLGRFGAMVDRALGLDDWVLERTEDTAAAAARLLQAPRSAADRRALRDRLLASALCDHAALARRFEQAAESLFADACSRRAAA